MVDSNVFFVPFAYALAYFNDFEWGIFKNDVSDILLIVKKDLRRLQEIRSGARDAADFVNVSFFAYQIQRLLNYDPNYILGENAEKHPERLKQISLRKLELLSILAQGNYLTNRQSEQIARELLMWYTQLNKMENYKFLDPRGRMMLSLFGNPAEKKSLIKFLTFLGGFGRSAETLEVLLSGPQACEMVMR